MRHLRFRIPRGLHSIIRAVLHQRRNEYHSSLDAQLHSILKSNTLTFRLLSLLKNSMINLLANFFPASLNHGNSTIHRARIFLFPNSMTCDMKATDPAEISSYHDAINLLLPQLRPFHSDYEILLIQIAECEFSKVH